MVTAISAKYFLAWLVSGYESIIFSGQVCRWEGRGGVPEGEGCVACGRATGRRVSIRTYICRRDVHTCRRDVHTCKYVHDVRTYDVFVICILVVFLYIQYVYSKQSV